jgi:MFS family permease
LLILVLGAVAGRFAELYRPAGGALTADLVPRSQPVTASALRRLAINAGMAAGPVVAGVLARHSFLFVFVGDALTSLTFAVVALVALPRGAHATHETARELRLAPARGSRCSCWPRP